MRELEIGRTVLGRSIVALSFEPPSYARPRDPAVVIAALHGDEPIGPACLMALANDLIERPPGRRAWIVPVLNVDGLAAGTKNNANDVDLDRNFAARDWSATSEAGQAPGSEPESEPETKALAALIDRTGATRLVTVHTTHRHIEWRGSGSELAQEMADLNGYPISHETRAPAPGSFASKYGVDRGCEVVTLEMPYLGVERDEEAERAWLENRAALRHVLDLPTG